MLQQSAILSDLDSLINADVDQVTEEQDEDQVVEQQSKKKEYRWKFYFITNTKKNRWTKINSNVNVETLTADITIYNITKSTDVAKQMKKENLSVMHVDWISWKEIHIVNISQEYISRRNHMNALNVVRNFGTTQHSTDINHQNILEKHFLKRSGRIVTSTIWMFVVFLIMSWQHFEHLQYFQ